MKNVYKLLVIAVLAMAVVFSFAACDTGTSSSSDSSSGNKSWPDNATLAKYNLDGWTLPDGFTLDRWEIKSDGALFISLTPYDFDKLKTALTPIGWTYSEGSGVGFSVFVKGDYSMDVYDNTTSSSTTKMGLYVFKRST